MAYDPINTPGTEEYKKRQAQIELFVGIILLAIGLLLFSEGTVLVCIAIYFIVPGAALAIGGFIGLIRNNTILIFLLIGLFYLGAGIASLSVQSGKSLAIGSILFFLIGILFLGLVIYILIYSLINKNKD